MEQTCAKQKHAKQTYATKQNYATPDYQCARCGYETKRKSSMVDHLYKRSTCCPTSMNDVELTEEVKRRILDNRVYMASRVMAAMSSDPPHCNSSSHSSINYYQLINNYNMITNYVAGLDPLEKLSKYVDYKKIELVDFGKAVEDKYQGKVQRLESSSSGAASKTSSRVFELKGDDFLELINEVSSVCNGKMPPHLESDDASNTSTNTTTNLNHFNILYDTRFNRLKLYEQGTWEEMLLMSGIKKILTTVQEHYLDAYEFYLIRTIHNRVPQQQVSPFKQQQCRELLKEYYQFIGAFEVDAYVRNQPDHVILRGQVTHDCEVTHEEESPPEEETYDLCDTYWQMYVTTRDNLKKSDINRIKKDVVDILKRNSIKNVEEMNKRVLDLFHIDETFKAMIFPQVSQSSKSAACVEHLKE